MLENSEKKQKILAQVLHWTVFNLGMLLLAVGVALFKAPNNFATGGVSGLSILLSKYITPLAPFLSQTAIMFIINVLLLIIGFIFLGKECTFRTAYCSVVYSLEMWVLQNFIIPEGFLPFTHGEQKFMEFCYAMLLTGAGSAIIFNCHASSGGTDIVALIIKKFSKINIGIALLISDLLIACLSFFIFDVETGLYSVLGLFAKSFLVDGVIESIGRSKCLTIITSRPELISPFILEGMHRGYTSYKARGGYTGEEKTIIITVCKRNEAIKLKIKIHQTDPSAFVILTNTNEILGKGFQTT